MKIKGFFPSDDFTKLRVDSSPCSLCKLFKGCDSPKMQPSGEGRKKILVIGEEPGEEEDKQGIQFVGETGRFLRRSLGNLGVDLDLDCWKDNAIRCRKPGNETPNKKEIQCCKEHLDRTIRELQPEHIWLFGGSAVQSYFMNRFTNTSITLWRGLRFPDHRIGAWVMPTFHPSFIKRKEDDKIVQNVFKSDLLEMAHNLTIEPLEKRVNVSEYYPNVIKLKTFDEIIAVLNDVLNKDRLITFDYETNCLKPFDSRAKIASIAFAVSEFNSYAFPYEYRDYWKPRELDYLKMKWVQVLTHPMKKVAQNIPYENMWSIMKFGVNVESWHSCTMNTTHLLDNRKGFTGLKFQSAVRYGADDYDKSVKHLLESKEGKFNRVMDIPLDDLLLYNGLDAIFTNWLFLDQQEEIGDDKKLKYTHDFIVEGLKALSDIQINGINIDTEYYLKEYKEIESKVKQLEKEIKSIEEIKTFENNKKRLINLDSDFDKRELFFKQMKLPSIKKTVGNLDSVDNSVISNIDHPIAKKMLERDKLEKTRGTYLAQFMREVEEDGRMHPFFNLHTVKTNRSSSDRPNFQNIPVRDEEAKRYTRSGIIPSLGNQILDCDYGSQEVRILACYTKDPALIEYINDPTSDMHRDQAMEIFLLEKSEVDKKIRFYAKNNLVFPLFYGSYYISCAKDLWKNCLDLKTTEGVKIKDHLAKRGIVSYVQFENHIKKVEEKFWKKLPKVKEWQEEVIDFFEKNQYIGMFHGFKYAGGIATRNEIINAPIQGTAFHCLLWSLIEINKIIKEEKLKTKIIGQIHDSIVFDCFPPEKETIKKITEFIATEEIAKVFPWLIVPLMIEWEETEVNQSWYYKKEVK
jgi:DNA polymerase-1